MKKGRFRRRTQHLQVPREENPGSGPGSTAVCTPTIDGAGAPRSGQSVVTTPKRGATRLSETIRSSSEAANGQPTLFKRFEEASDVA
jgi:hypothetical protein